MSASPAKPQPLDHVMLSSASRQHTATADKLAARIANCAGVVRQSLRDGQPAAPAARQIASDVMELVAEIAKLSEDSRFISWTRQPAA